VPTEDKVVMKFLLQKYALWFKDRVYTSRGLQRFGEVLGWCLYYHGMSGCDEKLDEIIFGIFQSRFERLPEEVISALDAFKKLLKKRLKKEKI